MPGQITVHDVEISVTKKLEAALRGLRGLDEYKAGIKLWADAICIYSHRTTMNYFESLRFVPQFSEGSNFTHLASQIWQYNRRIRTFAGAKGPPLGFGCSCPRYPSFVSAKPAAWKLRSFPLRGDASCSTMLAEYSVEVAEMLWEYR